MKKIYLITVVAFAILAFVGTTSSAQDYGYVCDTCPANWKNLEPLNNCGGPDQSPIAFSRKDAKGRDNAKLKFKYEPVVDVSPVETTTNYEWEDENPGANTIMVGGKEYVFNQFHFHSTAEHVINGERSDLEMHFVHKTEEEKTIVLAVFIDEGSGNLEFEEITSPDFPSDATVDLEALFPESTRSFRYVGSTTTPSCAADVQWNLFKEHVELSEDQIEKIRGWIWDLNQGFDNNRPIQNREGRRITNAK